MVTGYDEAVQVLGDPDAFSSCNSVTGPIPGFPVPLEGLDDQSVRACVERHRNQLPFSDQLPTFDPPTHTAHRALLSRLITPKRLSENEEFMWRLADRVLDHALPHGGDLIRGIATPFALLVIADLLGVPESDHDELTAALTADMAVGHTDDAAMAHTPLEYLYDRFGSYITDRRQTPGGDVMTEMAHARFPDGSLPEVIDVVRVAANLFSAGQETTVRLLSSAAKILAEDTALQDRLRREPDGLSAFIEEALRFESPIRGDFRLALAGTTVGDVTISAGTTLMVHNGAANRDPRQFADPDVFDPARPNARRHIAFGRGIHSCIGAPLARAEARVLLRRLLERTSAIRLDEGVHGNPDARHFQYVPSYVLRGLATLHLAYEPS